MTWQSKIEVCYWCEKGGETETHYHEGKWLEFHPKCWSEVRGVKGEQPVMVYAKKRVIKTLIVRRRKEENLSPPSVPQCICLAGRPLTSCPWWGKGDYADLIAV